MAAQPDTQPSSEQRARNAELLCDVLRDSELRLRQQASRHCELPSDVDDVLQSAYALFLERYKGIGEPLAWLYTTVKREAWATRRRGSRRRERSCHLVAGSDESTLDLLDATPTDLPGPAERVERNEQVAVRREALAGLKPDERRALWLLGLGLSYREIGEVTGWTHTKINRCLSEGRAALRSQAAST